MLDREVRQAVGEARRRAKMLSVRARAWRAISRTLRAQARAAAAPEAGPERDAARRYLAAVGILAPHLAPDGPPAPPPLVGRRRSRRPVPPEAVLATLVAAAGHAGPVAVVERRIAALLASGVPAGAIIACSDDAHPALPALRLLDTLDLQEERP